MLETELVRRVIEADRDRTRFHSHRRMESRRNRAGRLERKVQWAYQRTVCRETPPDRVAGLIDLKYFQVSVCLADLSADDLPIVESLMSICPKHNLLLL